MFRTHATTLCCAGLFAWAGVVGLGAGGQPPARPAPKAGANWWSIPDLDFVTQYGPLATGTQADQSRFAWMTFARANQPVPFGPDRQTFSQWELWASDLDTFSPNVPLFDPTKKLRPRPHLQPIQQIRIAAHARTTAVADANPFPQAGQEVTRNAVSSGYIADKHLNTSQGIARHLAAAGNRIEFPLGAIETKAVWRQGATPGAYQVGGLSLLALHLMVKVRPTPADPFTDNSPSWFWTTFELKSNPGLAAAQKFVTYGDTLPAGQVAQLLQEAGLASTPFANYVSNGQQVQFADAGHPAVILGNTQLEWVFATPPGPDPTTWTKWSSSCHTCHGQASGRVSGGHMQPFSFTPAGPVGPLAGGTLPPGGYRSYDFVWSLMLAQ